MMPEPFYKSPKVVVAIIGAVLFTVLIGLTSWQIFQGKTAVGSQMILGKIVDIRGQTLVLVTIAVLSNPDASTASSMQAVTVDQSTSFRRATLINNAEVQNALTAFGKELENRGTNASSLTLPPLSNEENITLAEVRVGDIAVVVPNGDTSIAAAVIVQSVTPAQMQLLPQKKL